MCVGPKQSTSKNSGCCQEWNEQGLWSKSSMISLETRVGSVNPGCNPKESYVYLFIQDNAKAVGFEIRIPYAKL